MCVCLNTCVLISQARREISIQKVHEIEFLDCVHSPDSVSRCDLFAPTEIPYAPTVSSFIQFIIIHNCITLILAFQFFLKLFACHSRSKEKKCFSWRDKQEPKALRVPADHKSVFLF